ncbi:MAG: acetyl-CoA carboxylase, carboxyltransferase subunit beta [Chlamydiota bacterium]
MGLFSRKPKIKVQSTKKDGFSGWIKCCKCQELIHANELKQHDNCCPKCDYHYRISVEQRIEQLCDEGSFQEFFTGLKPKDPLEFSDVDSYPSRIERAQQKSLRDEAVCVGLGKVFGTEVALGILDFNYMGGSMGSVVGERITRLIELAEKRRIPLIIVSSSGGARMQESIFSLMQMAKTSAALKKYRSSNLFYLSILTNPTTGGVTASFASLGDVIIAEPEALIGFAGPRVVEKTIGEKLPEGAQKSEFLLEKGMIDCIVPRRNLKKTVAFFIEFFNNKPAPSAPPRSLEALLEQAQSL